MTVMVIDYGVGNLASVSRALEECGASALVSDNPDDLKYAERVILPGVGAFADAMAQLEQRGWVEAIQDVVKNNHLPLLGICLGMHLLGDIGYEYGETKGLGLVPGVVNRLEPMPEERLPHVGWNSLDFPNPHPLFSNLQPGTDMYFVHSYHFVPGSPDLAIASTDYAGGFVSAVAYQNVMGVQFHPEKSAKPGFQVLKNFLAYANTRQTQPV